MFRAAAFHSVVGVAVLVLVLAPASPVQAGVAKASASRVAFQRAHPCPATGRPWGPCHGWVAMYVKPLCAGGADDLSNLQWQTAQDAQIKSAKDRLACRRPR
jgi:hypothetical protein